MLRGMVVVVVLSTTACGRIGFDPAATGDDAVNDAAGDSTTGDPSLQLHVTFEGSIVDVAKGRTVTCKGTCPALEAGRTSQAGRFDAAQCLGITSAPELETQSFTVALWFRSTDSVAATIFGKPYLGDTTNDNSFELWKDTDGSMSFTTTGNTQTPGGTFPTTMTWHHAAVTYSSGVVRTYLDGAAQSMATVPTMFAMDSLLIGCDFDIGVFFAYFRGQLDDIRFYSRALMASEIATLAQ